MRPVFHAWSSTGKGSACPYSQAHTTTRFERFESREAQNQHKNPPCVIAKKGTSGAFLLDISKHVSRANSPAHPMQHVIVLRGLSHDPSPNPCMRRLRWEALELVQQLDGCQFRPLGTERVDQVGHAAAHQHQAPHDDVLGTAAAQVGGQEARGMVESEGAGGTGRGDCVGGSCRGGTGPHGVTDLVEEGPSPWQLSWQK